MSTDTTHDSPSGGGVSVARALLLPPEIHAQAKARAQRRVLFAAIALIILIVAGGYAGSLTVRHGAEAGLADAQAQTASILAEQVQYSKVSVIQAKVAGIRSAQASITANEIDWHAYLVAVKATLPEEAVVQSMNITTATPGSPLPSAGAVLGQTGLAQLEVTATTNNVPDVVQWIKDFSALPGFAGATPTSLTHFATSYQSTFVVGIDDRALWHRFGTSTAQ